MLFIVRTLLLLVSLTGVAVAQPQILPGGPIIADGKSVAELRVWVPEYNGTDRLRIKPTHGQVKSTKVAPNGVATVLWIPGLVETAESIPVTVTVRGETTLDAALSVDVIPPRRGKLSVSFDPPLWREGVDAVTVTVKFEGTHPQMADHRQIIVNSNSGSIGEAVSSGLNEWQAQWTPPSDLSGSRFVVIGAADTTVPSKIYGYGVLTVQKQQSLSFGATPGSQNTLKIGSSRFGPMVASPQGTVAFSVPVDPKDRSGHMESVLPDGRTVKVAVVLPLAPFARVAFLPQPAGFDDKDSILVHLAGITENGQPSNSAVVGLNANGQDMGAKEYGRRTGYFSFEVPVPTGSASIPLHATLKDNEETMDPAQRAETTLIRAPVLARARLTTEPTVLSDTKTKVRLDTMGLDTNNMPALMDIRLHLSAGQVEGKPKVEGATTTTEYTIPEGTERVWIVAEPIITTSAHAPAHVLMWTSEDTVPTGGTLPVLMAVTDANGAPIANVPLSLQASGGGVLPGTITTSSNGIAVATYSAGMVESLATLRASGAGLVGVTGVYQGSKGTGPGPVAASDSRARNLIAKLRPSIPVQVLTKAPAIVAAAPIPAPVPTPTAAPAPTPAPAAAPPATAAAPPATAAAPPATAAAPTPATAAAAPAAAAPTPAAKKAKKAKKAQPSGAFGPPDLRASAALGLMSHSYTQTNGTKSNLVPPNAEYKHISPSFDLRGVYWIGQGPWGVAARTRLYGDAIEISGNEQRSTEWTIHTGARYRGEIQPGLHWYALGEVHRIGTRVVQYTNPAKQDEATSTSLFVFGLRVGGGIAVQLDGPVPLYIEAQLAETFAAAPKNTHLGVSASYPLTDNIGVRLAHDMDFKHLKAAVATTENKVREAEISPSIGVEYRGF